MMRALIEHWPEYLIEGTLLGVFMVVACATVVAVEHPASALRARLRSAFARRCLIGLAMGLTAVALIYSPPGQRSGAHMNPAFTLAFWALGRVGGWDALFYVLAQFAGGWVGVVAAAAMLRPRVAHQAIGYAATLPGRWGRGAAWIGEAMIAAVLMAVVLVMINRADAAPYTGLAAGALVAAFIALEAPFSGMSLNPARTLASALPARAFKGLWIYFTAPPLGMLAGAAFYLAALGSDEVYCAKLNHAGHSRCIFHCRHGDMRGIDRPAPTTPASGTGIESEEAPSPVQRRE